MDSGSLSLAELDKAEISIIVFLQQKYFPVELRCVTTKNKLPKSSKLRKLSPFFDTSGVLRVGGRLCNAEAAYPKKHPIIVPSCEVAKKLITHIHYQVGHLGRDSILSKLREKYWVLRANTLARSVTNNCFTCRKIQAKPSQQIMAELPRTRVTGDVPAFTHVGVDNFGPFNVSFGRKTIKRYGTIFTCSASRAIHLEISYSMTTDSFINTLRRFISRRGNILSLTCDNGTNFVGAEREIKESLNDWNQSKIGEFLLQKSIIWSFNPPSSSHWGGFYEREIRSVRKVFSSVMNAQNIRFNDEELSTLMCEVEAILNNRPLTEVLSEPENIALTPNHLLLLDAGITYPPGLFNKDDSYSQRRWRQVQYLTDLFWRRWHKQYIVLLQERQKWTTTQKSHEVGDIVLVLDISLPRNQWPLGRVVKVSKDNLGYVRSAYVKISKCKNSSLQGFQTSIICRPIVKLILLKSVQDM